MNNVNWFNVQFYNNNNTDTSIQITDLIQKFINNGVPSDKIVIGKPLHSFDGQNYVEPNVINNVIAKSVLALGGVMGWKLLDHVHPPSALEQRMATFNFF